MTGLLLFLAWLVFGPFLAPDSAEVVAQRAGKACLFGCIVEDTGRVHEMTREDVVSIALLARAESGPRFVPAESAATVWAMVQRFVEVNRRRPREDELSLSQVMRTYSAVLNDTYRTGGSKFHPRITPRADAYAGLGWNDMQRTWRLFAVEFASGWVDNPCPGCVHVLARGFEDSAAPDLVGPFYCSTAAQHPGGNAYYKTAETRWWTPLTVRVAPATGRLDPKVLPGGDE